MESLVWDDLRVLLAIHRHGSLFAAGKALGLSTSTTARRVDALEASLARRLVSRGQGGTELEPEALKFVRLAEQLEHGLAAEQRNGSATAGTVKVSVPLGSVQETAAALVALRRQYPDIDVELIGENRLSDIARREADVGLRLTAGTSRMLIEKHVTTLRFGIFGSPDYVRRNVPGGRLRKRDVARHPFVGLDSRWKSLPHEQWMTALGATRFPFRSSSVEAIVEAVQQGVGLAALVEQVGRRAGLVRLEVSEPGPTQPLYLVYHRELRRVPRVRAVVAALEASIRGYGS